jgi:hypothetical protein
MHTLTNTTESFEHLWAINPFGGRDIAHMKFVNLLNREELTPEMVIEKYQSYYDSLMKFQNGKYTKKIYAIKTIEEWIDTGTYKVETIVQRDPNDFYLYGIE